MKELEYLIPLGPLHLAAVIQVLTASCCSMGNVFNISAITVSLVTAVFFFNSSISVFKVSTCTQTEILVYRYISTHSSSTHN